MEETRPENAELLSFQFREARASGDLGSIQFYLRNPFLILSNP